MLVYCLILSILAVEFYAMYILALTEIHDDVRAMLQAQCNGHTALHRLAALVGDYEVELIAGVQVCSLAPLGEFTAYAWVEECGGCGAAANGCDECSKK